MHYWVQQPKALVSERFGTIFRKLGSTPSLVGVRMKSLLIDKSFWRSVIWGKTLEFFWSFLGYRGCRSIPAVWNVFKTFVFCKWDTPVSYVRTSVFSPSSDDRTFLWIGLKVRGVLLLQYSRWFCLKFFSKLRCWVPVNGTHLSPPFLCPPWTITSIDNYFVFSSLFCWQWLTRILKQNLQ